MCGVAILCTIYVVAVMHVHDVVHYSAIETASLSVDLGSIFRNVGLIVLFYTSEVLKLL